MNEHLIINISNEAVLQKTQDNSVFKSAVVSDCQNYRYSLTRIWDDSKQKVLFIMLNPSTADADNDDPTIRRCMGFAKQWGYGGLYVVNLFAFRATNPKDLLNIIDPIGSDNETWFKQMSLQSHLVVCAWGNSNIVNKLKKTIKSKLQVLQCINKPLHCIAKSKDGTPKHPLYLSSSLQPIFLNYNELIMP